MASPGFPGGALCVPHVLLSQQLLFIQTQCRQHLGETPRHSEPGIGLRREERDSHSAPGPPRTRGALITERVPELPDGQQPGAPSKRRPTPTSPVRSSVLRGRLHACSGASPHLHGLLEQVGPGLHPVLDALQLSLVLSKALSLLAPAGRRASGQLTMDMTHLHL